MGLIGRTIRVIKAKFNKALSSQENPVEQLDYTYEKMRDKRRDVKESVVTVKTQRKRLESKMENFQQDVEKHNRQAREAMEQDREDLARAALEKKKSKTSAIEDLEAQVDEMENVEEGMKDKLSEVENRLEELRTEKEVLKARFEGAEAMNTVNESMAEGIGDYSVEEAVGDIEEEIEEMQARAEAVNELEEEGEPDLEEELDDLTSSAEVEQEMESLRGELDPDSIDMTHPTEGEEELEKELA